MLGFEEQQSRKAKFAKTDCPLRDKLQSSGIHNTDNKVNIPTPTSAWDVKCMQFVGLLTNIAGNFKCHNM